MAQRFAIDGNFTQSFVGTVNLNASACPANIDDYASLYYDLDTGTVCYVTSSTDFCYEYVYGASDTDTPRSIGEYIPRSQVYSKPKRFTFAAYDTDGVGYDFSVPTQDVTDAVFVMFDSESVNAGDLSNYLLQNVTTGSLKLSTNTQAVEFDYTAQHTTGSAGQKKIILGNSNIVATASNPQFTLITKTSDEPFTNGETVCVEITRGGGGGGTSTTYQTGSSVQTNLNNLIIKDFDSNVFVTSDPDTGQLTLQFGTPSEPINLSALLNGFNTDRFNKEHDNYNVTFTYDLNGTTFESASLIDVTGGNEVVQVVTSDVDESINFNAFTGTMPQTTGSRTFKVDLAVTLTDGTIQSFTSNNAVGTLDKNDPGKPTITTVVSSDIQGGLYQNDGSSTTSFRIHVGATGSIVRDSGSGATNGYEYDGGDGFTLISSTMAANGNLTLNYTTETNEPSGIVRNFYKSPSGENDPDVFFTSSRSFTSQRRFAWKFGAAATASLLQGDLLDIAYLQNLGFQSSSNDNGFDEDPLGESFTIQGNSFDYHYLIVKDTVGDSTPIIKVNNQQVTFPEVAHYPAIEGGAGYRVFRTGQQGTAPVTYTYSAD